MALAAILAGCNEAFTLDQPNQDLAVNSSDASGSNDGNSNNFQLSQDPNAPSTKALVDPAPARSLRELTAKFPKGEASRAALCNGNVATDKFIRTFCSTAPPKITGLTDLYTALGLTNTTNVTCTTASAAITKKDTSVLNPHCIRFSTPGADPNATAVGYVRSSTPLAEIVSMDSASRSFRFYVVQFDLPCSATDSCTSGDYYTQAAESNWSNVSFYEDTALKNTPVDCTMCHQAAGVGSAKSLRMLETQVPWEHWFSPDQTCGKALFADFSAAHAFESSYAGLTSAAMGAASPSGLQKFVEGNGATGADFGNDVYNSFVILNEVANSSTGQPSNNTVPGISPTWTALYNQRTAGTNVKEFGGTAMTYHDCKQSDPSRLQSYTNNFIQVTRGSLALSSMFDLPTVNLDSPIALSERFLAPAQDMVTAEQIMSNACLSCHNSNLDQTITRAHFNAQDLSRNSAYEYGVAMGRIARTNKDLFRMPPPNFMDLTPTQIQTLTNYFSQHGGE
ncbi:MAG: hypothetical protein C5B49_12345 [Bdellovibrio sp.]|nr:MAG: hypothetical protein C5B49_12345 [Bdellovibrio sp.]